MGFVLVSADNVGGPFELAMSTKLDICFVKLSALPAEMSAVQWPLDEKIDQVQSVVNARPNGVAGASHSGVVQGSQCVMNHKSELIFSKHWGERGNSGSLMVFCSSSSLKRTKNGSEGIPIGVFKGGTAPAPEGGKAPKGGKAPNWGLESRGWIVPYPKFGDVKFFPISCRTIDPIVEFSERPKQYAKKDPKIYHSFHGVVISHNQGFSVEAVAGFENMEGYSTTDDNSSSSSSSMPKHKQCCCAIL